LELHGSSIAVGWHLKPSALKAPTLTSPGQRPGSGIHRFGCALKGRRGSRPPFQGGYRVSRARYPGRCPGLITSAPLARHHGRVCERKYTDEMVYRITRSHRISN
jgi:hypothetical protein